MPSGGQSAINIRAPQPSPQRFVRPTGLISPSPLFYFFHNIVQAHIIKYLFPFFRVVAESSCELIKKAYCICRSELIAQ
jgi:hypothetical protein